MNEFYDIIVVGGGPAGLMAAKYAAERGASVLLFEKDRQIGLPVRCAEGVSEKGLREIIQVRERWISRCIQGIKLIAPDGTEFEAHSDDRGFILNRHLFETDLAEMAAQAGAQIRTKSFVKGLLFDGERISGVIVEHLGFTFRIHAKLVIGADGVESRIGFWSGVLTTTSPEDMQSCVQMTCSGMEFDPNVVTLLYGRKIAPDGYLWIFPKSETMANVGVTISGAQTLKKKPLYFLREYIESRYPLATVTCIVAGCYSAGPALKKFVKDGVMLIGDAAHQTNPLTGGGIINAMIAGEMAGRIGAEAVLAEDVSEKRLSAYPKEWKRIGDRDVSLAYRVKKVVDGFDDARMNEIANTLVQLPPEKRTPIHILKTAFMKHPKLVLEAARMFI